MSPPLHIFIHKRWRRQSILGLVVRFGLYRPLPGLLSLQSASLVKKICAQGAHSPTHLSLQPQFSPPVPLPLGLALARVLPPWSPSPVPPPAAAAAATAATASQPASSCSQAPRTPGAPPGGGGHCLLSAPDLRGATGGYQLGCGGGCVPKQPPGCAKATQSAPPGPVQPPTHLR